MQNVTPEITNAKTSVKVIKKKPIVAISIPTRVGPGSGLGLELVNWLLREIKLSERDVLPYRVIIHIVGGKPQNVTANILVRAFFECDPIPDYFFKIDDDLDPDPGLISRLISRNVDFVAGAVAIWHEGSKGVKICAYEKEDKRNFADYKKNPFGHCYFVGGGCILLSKKFMMDWKKNVSLHPFYESIFHREKGMIQVGSDERLCQNAHFLGYKTYYDATNIISQKTEINIGANTGIEEDDFFRTVTQLGNDGQEVGLNKMFKLKGR